MIYTYFNYAIRSNIPIPELVPMGKGDQAAVTFSLESGEWECFPPENWFYQWKSETGSITISVARTEKHYTLEFSHLARFNISPDARTISCRKYRNVPDSTIRHLLLDQALPRCFYHFFDKIILHSSLISITDRGVAFLGETGWGKSTLALSFTKIKSDFITDDCIMLEKRNGRVKAVASYTGVRLFEDSLQFFQKDDQTKLEETAHYSSKKRAVLADQFKKSETLLHTVFFLNNPYQGGNADTVDIIEMDKLAAVPELIRHGFSLDVENKNRQKRQLQQLSEILDCDISFYELNFPRSYEILDAVHKGVYTAVTHG